MLINSASQGKWKLLSASGFCKFLLSCEDDNGIAGFSGGNFFPANRHQVFGFLELLISISILQSFT
jgi:hypothetical protein